MSLTTYPVNHNRKAYMATAAVDSSPSIIIADVFSIKNGDAILDFSIAASHNGVDIMSGLKNVLKRQIGDKLNVVAGTLFATDKTNRNFRVALKAQVVSKPYNDETLKDMHVTSANIFKDSNDDSLWKVIGEGDNKRIVLVSHEDQGAILKALYDPNMNRIHAAIADDNMCHQGDFCAFYDVASAETKFGFAIAYKEKENVFVAVAKDSKDLIEFEPATLLACVDVGNYKPKFEAKAAVDSNTREHLNNIINYYRTLYGEKNDLIAGWEALLRGSKRA